MTIRQISIYLENKPGKLSAMCKALAEADINIATLSLADTTDFGIVRMIVDDHDKSLKVLAAAGYAVKVSEVVAVCVPDRPGGMAEVMAALDGSGANVEYAYAFSFHHGEKAVLVFRFDDSDRAESALKQSGFITLTESEVYEAGR